MALHLIPRTRRGRAGTFLVSMVLALSAAGLGTGANALYAGHEPVEPIDDPIPGHIDEGRIQLELETVAEGKGLTAPNWGTYAPGIPDVLFVVDQDGPLWAVNTKTGKKKLVLSTADLLVPLILEADERGFLGLAFHPDFATNGLLYTMTSEPIDPANPPTPATQPNHMATVREWTVPNPTGFAMRTEPLTSAASRVIFDIEEPQFNHNGGALFFGQTAADSDLLYITLGDGGCADDQNGQLGLAGEGPCISHEGPGNAQRDDTLLGKIVRMDPLTDAAPTVFAKGFRNPFRASADRETGEIWAGDAGQNHIEEVDKVVQGGNYGWRVKEGTFLFEKAGIELLGFASDGFVFKNSPGAPAGLIDPVAQYDHDEGVAAIGGFVYRGSAIPKLQGRYVFGDYSDGFNSANGRVMYVVEDDKADPEDRTPNVFNLVNGHINLFVLGFGEDMNGELYVLANKSGGPDEEEGVVMKIVRECADDADDCRD